MEFRQHKRDYYCHKLGYSKVTEAVFREQAIRQVYPRLSAEQSARNTHGPMWITPGQVSSGQWSEGQSFFGSGRKNLLYLKKQWRLFLVV